MDQLIRFVLTADAGQGVTATKEFNSTLKDLKTNATSAADSVTKGFQGIGDEAKTTSSEIDTLSKGGIAGIEKLKEQVIDLQRTMVSARQEVIANVEAQKTLEAAYKSGTVSSEQYTTMSKQLSDRHKELAAAVHESQYEFRTANQELSSFSQSQAQANEVAKTLASQIGLNLPEGITKFLTRIPEVQGALRAAFDVGVVATFAVALGEALAHVVVGIINLRQEWQDFRNDLAVGGISNAITGAQTAAMDAAAATLAERSLSNVNEVRSLRQQASITQQTKPGLGGDINRLELQKAAEEQNLGTDKDFLGLGPASQAVRRTAIADKFDAEIEKAKDDYLQQTRRATEVLSIQADAKDKILAMGVSMADLAGGAVGLKNVIRQVTENTDIAKIQAEGRFKVQDIGAGHPQEVQAAQAETAAQVRETLLTQGLQNLDRFAAAFTQASNLAAKQTEPFSEQGQRKTAINRAAEMIKQDKEQSEAQLKSMEEMAKVQDEFDLARMDKHQAALYKIDIDEKEEVRKLYELWLKSGEDYSVFQAEEVTATDAATAKKAALEETWAKKRQELIQRVAELSTQAEEGSTNKTLFRIASINAAESKQFDELQKMYGDDEKNFAALQTAKADLDTISAQKRTAAYVTALQPFGNELDKMLTGFMTGGKSISQIFVSLIDDLSNMAIKLLVINPLLKEMAASLDASQQTGGGGILSGILGGLAGIFTGGTGEIATTLASQVTAPSTAFLNSITPFTGDIPGLAVGGDAAADTPYLVGENGPELFVPKNSGSVVPNSGLTSMGGHTVNITNNNDFRGANPGTQQQILAALDQLHVRSVRDSVAAIQDLQYRRA